MIGSSLSHCGLSEKGVLVLGVERGKHWIPIPKPEQTIQERDRLVAYGHLQALKTLFRQE
ncbi:MAG: hypothetical protein GTO24_04510 [candidate division Zixibacteria bacterium]|nr:hypothetical protein [candidate division Zixibacteria bacterium]